MRPLAHLLLVLLTAPPPAAEPTVTVTLRQEAVVDDAALCLAHVAAVDGQPADLVERLGAVDVGRAPAPGAARSISRSFLAARLRQERIDPAQVTWAGTQATRVSRRSTCIPGAAIAQAAADEFRKALPWPDDDIVIEVHRPPADVHLLGPATDVRYAIAVRPGQRLLGLVPVDITLSREGRALGRATAMLGVRVFQRVVVARRRIRRGEVISKDLVRLQRAELSSPNDDVATDLAAVLGREARHDVPAFAALTGRALAAARVVRRGTPVMLVARRGRLRVTALGIAEQDGALGQFIPVRNRDSQKIVHGRVVDARTVEVPF